MKYCYTQQAHVSVRMLGKRQDIDENTLYDSSYIKF